MTLFFWRRCGKTILFFVILSLIALFGFHGRAGADKVSPDLLQVLGDTRTDETPVILTFAESPLPEYSSAPASKARRTEVPRLLKERWKKLRRSFVDELKKLGAREIKPLWNIDGVAFTAHPELIREIAGLPEVAEIRYDAEISLVRQEEYTPAVSEWNLDAVYVPDLWKLGLTGEGIVVAVTDTGVDLNHPDLKDRWRGGQNSWFNPFAGQCQGTSDCSDCDRSDQIPCDEDGHGTGVTGIMVGGDSSGRAIGVAPGAKWIAAKIFKGPDGKGSLSAIHASYQWMLDPDGDPATDDAPDVVNNSWGFENLPDRCNNEFRKDLQALRAAGIAVVFSAGNGGPAPNSSISPANYPEAFAVGGVRDLFPILGTEIDDMSSRGPSACDGAIYPDIVAPGVEVRTAGLTENGSRPDSFEVLNGTSFAAPVVAGTMALLLEAFSDSPAPLSISDLEWALTRSAAGPSPEPDNLYGYGRVNALAAYEFLIGPPKLAMEDAIENGSGTLVSFGHVPPHGKAQKTLELSNAGSGSMGIGPLGGLEASAAFTLEDDRCSGQVLQGGQTCSLTLSFSPPDYGRFQARLVIETDRAVNEQLIVDLEGAGNHPPGPIALLSPENDALEEGEVEFRWIQPEDADGDALSLSLFLSETADFKEPSRILMASREGRGKELFACASALLLGSFFLGKRKRRRRPAIVVLLLLLLLITSCGGDSGSATGIPSRQSIGDFRTGLNSESTYFWKILAEDPLGGTSESPVRIFHTQ